MQFRRLFCVSGAVNAVPTVSDRCFLRRSCIAAHETTQQSLGSRFRLIVVLLRRNSAVFLRLRCRQSCLDRVGPLFFAAQLHFSARNYATIGRKPFSSHCRSFASKFCGFFASPVPSMLSRPCRTAVFCGPAASPVPSMLS
jgi:hypothetical protein